MTSSDIAESSQYSVSAPAVSECALSIVIVNWNSGTLLANCLASLQREIGPLGPTSEIVIVDNGSTDASMELVEVPGLALRSIHNGRNLGFGRACNLGAAAACGQLLLFLNPDCEVRAGSIERCVNELQSVAVGVCGVALMDESGNVARSCHRFPSLWSFCSRILGLHSLSRRWSSSAMTNWDHRNDADVDHVIGAFYAMRRDLFDQLGGFDERFFVYLEDLDLSLRVRRAGHRVRFLATPASFHLGGGVSRQIKARRLFYSTRSRILYAYKHFPRWQAHLHLMLTLFVEPFTRSVLALARGSGSTLRETCSGFSLVWRDLLKTLRLAHRP